jgi:tetratricopeptide (TPR) repeat protein
LSSTAAGKSLPALVHDMHDRITQERKARSAAEWAEVRQRVVEFAALEATMAQLPPVSQTLLAQLSVFRRPFPLQALEQGLAATPLAWQPLLDWSLLRYDPTDKAYRLHSLTAHHVADRLSGTERTATQHRAAVWYEQYADQSRDLADMLEAHRLFSEAGEGQRAGALANDLAEPLSRFGLYDLWQTLCQTTTTQATGIVVAEAQRQLGMIAQAQGAYEEARRLYGQSMTIHERLGDQRGQASTLHQLGMIAQDQGAYEEARRLYGQSMTIKERLGDQRGQAARWANWVCWPANKVILTPL